MTKQSILTATIISAVTVFIYLGFGIKTLTISSCHTRVESLHKAEYSEVECMPDFEGIVSCSTDFWDEPASDTHYAVTVDGELTDFYGTATLNTSGYFDIDKPVIWDNFEPGLDFDYFSHKYDAKHEVRFENGEYNTQPTDDYQRCLDNIGVPMLVKHWYGNAYSTHYE